jgi:hypothetical protein
VQNLRVVVGGLCEENILWLQRSMIMENKMSFGGEGGFTLDKLDCILYATKKDC